MKIRRTGHTLESFKLFPLIAWSFIIGFAVFVYSMASNLQSASTELESQANFVEATSKKTLDEHTDFEAKKLPR